MRKEGRKAGRQEGRKEGRKERKRDTGGQGSFDLLARLLTCL